MVVIFPDLDTGRAASRALQFVQCLAMLVVILPPLVGICVNSILVPADIATGIVVEGFKLIWFTRLADLQQAQSNNVWLDAQRTVKACDRDSGVGHAVSLAESMLLPGPRQQMTEGGVSLKSQPGLKRLFKIEIRKLHIRKRCIYPILITVWYGPVLS